MSQDGANRLRLSSRCTLDDERIEIRFDHRLIMPDPMWMLMMLVVGDDTPSKPDPESK